MKKMMEKQYLDYYRQYLNRSLTFDDLCKKCEDIRYIDKQDMDHILAYDGVWLQWVNNEWVFESYLSGHNKRKLNVLAGYEKPRTWVKVFALLLVLVLFVNIIFPDAMNDTNLWLRSSIAQLKAYKSPKIDQEYLPGLEVKAPKGALMEGQSINVTELDLGSSVEHLANADVAGIPLYAFDFDAGMNEDESFNKPVNITMDLQTLDVSKNGYDELSVYRQDDNGNLHLLESRVKGNQLLITTEKNCWMFIVQGIVYGTAVLYTAYSGTKKLQKYNWDYHDYYAFRIPNPKYNYIIYIHTDYVTNFADLMKQIRMESNALMAKYGLEWSDSVNAYIPSEYAHLEQLNAHTIDTEMINKVNEKMRQLKDDVAYQELKEKLSIDNLPPPVQAMVEAVSDAHDYLFEERKLRPIGHQVDIILLEPWQPEHKVSEAALAIYGYTEDSYIHVNPGVVKDITSKTPTSKASMDDLKVTLVHEMLHCVQNEYYPEDLKYSEALAMMFEAEAARYFAKEKTILIGNYKPTNRVVELLNRPFKIWTDQSLEQTHGYSFSFVLEYIRDSQSGIFNQDKDAYLLKLLESRDGKDSVEAILSTIKGDDKQVMYNYLKSINEDKLFAQLESNNENIVFADVETSYEMKFQDREMTINTYYNHISRNLKKIEEPGSVIIYYIDDDTQVALTAMEQHVMYLTYPSVDPKFDPTKSWHEIDSTKGFHVVPVSDISKETRFMRNRIYITDDGLEPDMEYQASIKAFAAVMPEPVTTVTFDEESLTFKVKLDAVNHKMKDLWKGRIVELAVPGTSIVPYQLNIKPGETEGTVHLLELLVNEGDESLFDFSAIGSKMVATIISGTMKSSLRMMAVSSNGMLKTKEQDDNAMYIGIDSGFTYEDEKGMPVNVVNSLREKGIPHGLSYSVDADEDFVNINMRTDYGAYIRLYTGFKELFKYLFFTTLDGRSGIDMDKVNKRLEDLNNARDVVVTVRNAYSGDNNLSMDTIKKVEDIYHKTGESIIGPPSLEEVLTMPFVTGVNNGIPKSSYSGQSLFKIQSNVEKVVRTYRKETKDKRITYKNNKELEEYLETNSGYLNKVHQDKGYAAMEAVINEEIQSISEETISDETEFDEEFYKAFNEMVNLLNNQYYYLDFQGNTVSLSFMDESMKGTYSVTDKPGVFLLSLVDTQKNTHSYEMILTPDGKLLLKGEYIVFK